MKAIGLGIVLQVVTYVLTWALHLQAPTAVALGLGLTVAFYLVVLWLVLGRVHEGVVRPVWHLGAPGTAAAIGMVTGLGQAGVVVLLNSSLAGRITSDPVATLVLAQGGLLRVGALVLVMVVCAPFIEELLFRGLLAESLRPRGKGAAIWLSALAFALWHLRPDAIRYYLLCGALLGLLYWKRGLVCSMAAHATFNGTLVAVAALSISGPSHAVTAAGVSLSAPASWHQVVGSEPTAVELRSATGAQMFVHRVGGRTPVDAAVLARKLTMAPTLGPGVTVTGAVRSVQYPAGSGAAVDVNDNGRDGETVVIASPQGVIEAELLTNGNTNARGQFDSMLQSLHVT